MISPTELSAAITSCYAAADAQLVASGQPKPARIYVPKRYTIFMGTVVHGGPAITQQINISANGDFFLTRMTYAASLAFAAQTYSSLVLPELLVQVTDSGSDELFANQAVEINSMACLSALGEGGLTDEPYPRVISGRSTITIAMNNVEAANDYNVYFSLIGVLVKTWGGGL